MHGTDFFFFQIPHKCIFFQKGNEKEHLKYVIFLNLADKILLGSNIFYFITDSI